MDSIEKVFVKRRKRERDLGWKNIIKLNISLLAKWIWELIGGRVASSLTGLS